MDSSQRLRIVLLTPQPSSHTMHRPLRTSNSHLDSSLLVLSMENFSKQAMVCRRRLWSLLNLRRNQSWSRSNHRLIPWFRLWFLFTSSSHSMVRPLRKNANNFD